MTCPMPIAESILQALRRKAAEALEARQGRNTATVEVEASVLLDLLDAEAGFWKGGTAVPTVRR